jgi:hypothetical protein
MTRLTAARALSLSAAPIFAAMAVMTLLAPDTCGASRLTGMGAMYVLMSAFHLGPWLRVTSLNIEEKTS